MYMYVPSGRPKSWTEWDEFFCGHSWVTGGCYRLKKIRNFFPLVTPGPSASIQYNTDSQSN